MLAMTTALLLSTWTPTDTAIEAGTIGLLAVDYAQTLTIARNPIRFHEHNPILGRHPSAQAVNAYFAACALAHVAVAAALPPKWRRAWQSVTIAVQLGAVTNNRMTGISMSVPW